MAANGKTVILTPKEIRDLKRKVATFINQYTFCQENGISQPVLKYPLLTGRCSEKTYNKIINAKTKEELAAA